MGDKDRSVCVYVFINKYVYVYMCIDKYLYVYTYIHTDILVSRW